MRENEKIYEPRRSIGGLFTGFLLVFFILMAVLIFRPIILNPSERMGIIALVLTGPVWTLFILISLFFLICYPTLKYKLFNEKLILKCGPFRSEISLRDIRKIREKNLKFDVSSTGLKLPGYCLFRVKYRDEDWVRMYSRAVLKDIILIETDREKFGITPKDKEGFLRDILERIGEDKLEEKTCGLNFMKEFRKRNQKDSQLEKSFLDKKIYYLELFPTLIIIVTIFFDLIYFPSLPSQIPVHYNINGIADNWGSKSIIFTLPGIMIFIYLFLFLINRLLILRKHPRLYLSLYFVYTTLLIVFGAIDFGTVFIAFGKLKSLIAISIVPLILFFMSILNLLISVLWAAKREQK